MRRGLAFVAALLPALACAQATPWQAEFGAGHESLSGGLGDWQQADLALRGYWAPRSSFELNARATERFGRRDRGLGAGVAWPLENGWGATLTANASTTHQILARWSLGADLQRAMGSGWVLGGGLRATRYDIDRANALSFTAERYFGSRDLGDWRAAATVTSTRLAGLATSHAARVQVDRYFGERGRLGLLVASGREIENLGQGSLVISGVQSIAVVARWPLGPTWALTGEIAQTRLGSLYRRSGGRLGVQLDF